MPPTMMTSTSEGGDMLRVTAVGAYRWLEERFVDVR